MLLSQEQASSEDGAPGATWRDFIDDADFMLRTHGPAIFEQLHRRLQHLNIRKNWGRGVVGRKGGFGPDDPLKTDLRDRMIHHAATLLEKLDIALDVHPKREWEDWMGEAKDKYDEEGETGMNQFIANLNQKIKEAKKGVTKKGRGRKGGGRSGGGSEWVQHVKQYALHHGIPYGKALKEAKASYHSGKKGGIESFSGGMADFSGGMADFSGGAFLGTKGDRYGTNYVMKNAIGLRSGRIA